MTDRDHEIPVIDVGGLLAGRPAAAQEVAAEIRRACLDSGFFYISGHGVSEDLVAEAFEQNRRFHARPLAEKLEIKLNQWHRGYQPFATSTLVSSARFAPARHANQLESFFLRHEVPADEPGYLAQELAGPNQWPDDAGFRDVVGRYDAALTSLGLGLLPAVALAVGEPADFFDGFFDPPSTTLRLIHYPPMAADGSEELFGIHPHTDYGFLTILAQDAVGGLEVQRVDGGWFAAPPIPGTFVVNVGDILARWTNDVFNSTPHRVINRSPPRERYSIGMFFDPNVETVVRCLDGFVDRARPAKHAPIRYGDYFAKRLDANYPDRVGVGSAAREQPAGGAGS